LRPAQKCNTPEARSWVDFARTARDGTPDDVAVVCERAAAVGNSRARRSPLKRIDTHSHPKISKHFRFDPRAIVRMAGAGRRVGLDGLSLTEHFHARGFWQVYEHLSAAYARREGVFWTDGLALIPGAEVNIREGAHVIVLGEVAELERLDRSFSAP